MISASFLIAAKLNLEQVIRLAEVKTNDPISPYFTRELDAYRRFSMALQWAASRRTGLDHPNVALVGSNVYFCL